MCELQEPVGLDQYYGNAPAIPLTLFATLTAPRFDGHRDCDFHRDCDANRNSNGDDWAADD